MKEKKQEDQNKAEKTIDVKHTDYKQLDQEKEENLYEGVPDIKNNIEKCQSNLNTDHKLSYVNKAADEDDRHVNSSGNVTGNVEHIYNALPPTYSAINENKNVVSSRKKCDRD